MRDGQSLSTAQLAWSTIALTHHKNLLAKPRLLEITKLVQAELRTLADEVNKALVCKLCDASAY